MIRYLEEKEKNRSRALWEEAFPEDSPAFLDYYYSRYEQVNRILVREEDRTIQTMVHLNPYGMRAGKWEYVIDYIVGVATRADCRHRGYMSEALNRLLADQYRERKPFTFLMPAAPGIYEPFQFTYIFDRPTRRLKGSRELVEKTFENSGWTREELAGWINGWLEKRFSVYCLRDSRYVEHMLEELKSERGILKLLFSGGRMAGLESTWGLEKREVRELLCEEEYTETAGADKPAIMARIVNLEEFVRAISLREDCPEKSLRVSLQISDPLIGENDGVFLWELEKDTSRIIRTGDPAETVAVSIDRLTGWLFGYDSWDEGPEWKKWIKTLTGVYIDEVV